MTLTDGLSNFTAPQKPDPLNQTCCVRVLQARANPRSLGSCTTTSIDADRDVDRYLNSLLQITIRQLPHSWGLHWGLQLQLFTIKLNIRFTSWVVHGQLERFCVGPHFHCFAPAVHVQTGVNLESVNLDLSIKMIYKSPPSATTCVGCF